VLLPGALRIPRQWQKLLAIKEFGTLANYPPKSRRQPAPKNPRPFRNDRRQISLQAGCYMVTLELNSGNRYYWLEHLVFKRRDQDKDFSTARAVFRREKDAFELPRGEQHLKLPTGEQIRFKVEIE